VPGSPPTGLEPVTWAPNEADRLAPEFLSNRNGNGEPFRPTGADRITNLVDGSNSPRN
jgi:hypothetical protein